MKSKDIIFIVSWLLSSCIDHSIKKVSVFEQKFRDKSELLANGFKQSRIISYNFGKKDTEIMEYLYFKGFGDTTVFCQLNHDNSIKLFEIVLRLNKTDTVALYGFLHKIGFWEQYRSGSKSPLFFTNKQENIEYQVDKYKYLISFTQWLDTTKHPPPYSVNMDSASTSAQ